ncbi:MAG: ParB/RepB/Spo0J family partition protein [Anaplasmataceae bacterium]|nr:ParB/RepB/Spo0J family partition protein [Anaplasmataceae bacterium]
MTNNKLGKGLSSLISQNEEEKEDSGAEILEIEINNIIPGKFQPRNIFDKESLDILSRSIKENGILQPIIVRKIDRNKYEIIAGERRWRAANLINMTHVPCIIKDLTDKNSLEISLIENIHRENLNPIEEAESYIKLIELFNYTHESLAELIGKSRTHVTNYIRILNLPKYVLNKIENHSISVGHAKALIGTANIEEVVDKIIDLSLSVRDTEKLIKNINSKNNLLEKPKIIKTDDMKVLEQKISEKIGLNIAIHEKNEKGTVKIKFKNFEELGSILDIISDK